MHRSAGLLVFLLSLANPASAAIEIEVGGRQIVVTVPDGYAELTSGMSPYYETMQAYVSPASHRYLSLIPEDKAVSLSNGEFVEFERYMNIESPKELAAKSVTSDMFDELRNVLRTRMGEVMDEANKQVGGMIASGNAEVSSKFNADVDFSVGNMAPLPVHLDTVNTIGYSMYVNLEGSVNGEASNDAVVVTQLAIHVKDKLLFLYVYGAESDLEWTRNFADDWAAEIFAANAASAEPNTGGESAFPALDSSGDLAKALIGAVLVSIIALVGILVYRRRNQ